MGWAEKVLDGKAWLEDWALRTFRPRTWARRENDHRERVWFSDCRTADLQGQPLPPRPSRVKRR